MKKSISVKNLTFKYNDHLVFEDFSFDLLEGDFLSIVGCNGSGKTTLLKILSREITTNANIKILDVAINDPSFNDSRKFISFVLEQNNYDFISETVEDEIVFALENLNYKPKDMKIMVKEIAKKFNIESILTKDPTKLNFLEKEKVLLAAALITNPKILIIDSSLAILNKYELKDILLKLQNIQKERELSVILLTRNLNETLYGNKIIVIEKGHKIIEGPTLEVLKKDRLFSRLGINLPFMVDLSLKLKFYELLDDIVLDMKRMVKILWK